MGGPLRICTLADQLLAVGGIERVQLEVCRRLAERGHEMTVLAKRLDELTPQWEAFARVEAVPGFTVRRDRPLAGLRRVARTARRAAAAGPDVLYVHRHAVLQTAWPASVLARGAGIVCHLHATAPPHRGAITRFLHRRVDRYLAVSDAVARSWTAAGVPAARLVTVPNGIDTDRFAPPSAAERARARARLDLPPDAFVVVFTGRVVPGKGVHVLADAVSRLAAEDPTVHLLVVGGDPAAPAGDDDRDFLAEVARRAPSTTRWLPRQVDVRPFLWAADVAAVPSTVHDAHPLGVLEALACGLPVVASDLGGIPEQLTGRLAGWLVPPGDVDALTRVLRSLRWWRRDHPEVGDRCRHAAVARFSIPRMVDRVEEALVTATRRRSTRAR